MCLYTTEYRPKIAKEDITTWKVVRIGGTKDGKPVLNAPYYDHFYYEIGKRYKNHFPLKKEYYDTGGEGKKVYSVSVAFHSFTDFSNAHLECKGINVFTLSRDYTVVECTIPKGTKYYTDLIEQEIASEEIIINRIVEKTNDGKNI